MLKCFGPIWFMSGPLYAVEYYAGNPTLHPITAPAMSTQAVSARKKHLLDAFSQADYVAILASGSLPLQVGKKHPALDAAIDGRSWAILTACNPGAHRLDDRYNRRRHRQLLDELVRKALDSWPAINRDPAGGWPDEPSALIAGITLDQLDRLADRFGQAAALYGFPNDHARLRLYGPDWPSNLPDWTESIF